MKKLIAIACLAFAAPLAAMSSTSEVAPGNSPVPVAELNALSARQACASRAHAALPAADRQRFGKHMDDVRTGFAQAQKAQRVDNRAVFNQERTKVANAIAAMGFRC